MKLSGILFLFCSVAFAGESLNDPLKPPAGFAQGGQGELNASATDVNVGSRLSSIVLPQQRGGVASAVIDGKLVRLGEKVGEMKLIRLNTQEAVLQGPAGREVLSLTPDISKKMQDGKKAQRRQKETQ